MFAQSSVLFAKKASYVQADAADAATAASSKRKRSSKSEDAETEKPVKTAHRRMDDDEIDEEEAAADAAESSMALPEKKKPKKKKHKVLAREAAEAAAAAAQAAGTDAAVVETADADDAAAPSASDSDKSERTVFVGNVSLDATQKDLKAFFAQCGKVESVRLRSMPIAGCAVDQHGNQKLMMKVCANKKILLDSKDHCNAYVTFAERASVEKALALNGATLLLLKIRVDRENPVVDPKRSVFVGNVGFGVSDEAVRKFFEKRLASDEEPAPVHNVRIIRDRTTGAGKGFGYVLLASAALAAKALSLNESKLDGRPVRVQVCGKRFKNRKGEEDATKKHEGVRASVGAKARVALKRKAKSATEAPAKKTKLAASATKVQKPKHAARKALQAAGGKTLKKAPGGKKPIGRSGKKPERAPKVKVQKPKHAARKARQAAEAAAVAAKK